MPLASHRRRSRDRVELQLTANYRSPRGYRELSAFVQYCVGRIERELGDVGRWRVCVAPRVDGIAASIDVVAGERVTHASTLGYDGPLAIWDAMCRVEQALRERTAAPVRGVL